MNDLFHPEDYEQQDLEQPREAQPKEEPASSESSDFEKILNGISDKGAEAADWLEQMTKKGTGAAADWLASLPDKGREAVEWLEDLVKQLFKPVTDLIEEIHKGIETEQIKPSFDVPSKTPEQPTETAEADEGGERTGDVYHINDAMEQWHVQDGNMSCAVCSQQFIINEFLDLDVSEAELCKIAQENGWFDPEIGTYPADCDNLLEYFGIDTDMRTGAGYEDIKATLDNGGRVIVGVDSAVLWVEGYGNYPVYGADHAIEVIGVDDSNPNDVRIIINDSGEPGGCGRSVPLREFLEAWEPSGGFMISAYRNN